MENLESNILNETNRIIRNSPVNQILHQVGEEVRRIMEEDYISKQNLSLIELNEGKIKWYLLSLTSRLKIDRTKRKIEKTNEKSVDSGQIKKTVKRNGVMINLRDSRIKSNRTAIELIDISRPKERIQDDDLDIAR